MIKILIDSGSDLDLKEAEKFGVSLISMEVMFNDEVYLDGVNLTHEEFFKKLVENNEMPKTSQINEFRFKEAYEKLTKDGSQLIVMTMSSKMSGTFANAHRAAENFKGLVYPIDTLNVTIGERILLYYALDLIKQGKDIDFIVKELNEKKLKIKLIGIMGTLKYLKRGGRISTFTAIVGETLAIKPAIGIIDGEVKIIGKAIGSKMSFHLFDKLMEKTGEIDYDMPYCFAYSGNENHLLDKYFKLKKFDPIKENDQLERFMIGSTIGTHIGPDAYAIAYFAK